MCRIGSLYECTLRGYEKALGPERTIDAYYSLQFALNLRAGAWSPRLGVVECADIIYFAWSVGWYVGWYVAGDSGSNPGPRLWHGTPDAIITPWGETAE